MSLGKQGEVFFRGLGLRVIKDKLVGKDFSALSID